MKNDSSTNPDPELESKPDPLKPKSLRLDPAYLQQGAVKKLLITIPVRKPPKSDFIRVHPDPKFHGVFGLIELKEEREVYVVDPPYHPYLEPAFQTPFHVFLAINRQGVPFIWHIRAPGPDGRQNPWSTSALEAVEHAMKKWVRVTPDQSLQGYNIVTPELEYTDPIWPAELTSIDDAIQIAFKGKIIEGPDHPVIKKLRGAL